MKLLRSAVGEKSSPDAPTGYMQQYNCTLVVVEFITILISYIPGRDTVTK